MTGRDTNLVPSNDDAELTVLSDAELAEEIEKFQSQNRFPPKIRAAIDALIAEKILTNSRFDPSLKKEITHQEKYGVAGADLVTAGIEAGSFEGSAFWGKVAPDDLSEDDRLTLVSRWAKASSSFVKGLIKITAAFEDADPAKPAPTLEDITPDQMQTYRLVTAAMSRAYRANLTPEQAAHESKQAVKRVAAFREHMTPEQRAERNATEAERLRRKRALAKAPQP